MSRIKLLFSIVSDLKQLAESVAELAEALETGEEAEPGESDSRVSYQDKAFVPVPMAPLAQAAPHPSTASQFEPQPTPTQPTPSQSAPPQSAPSQPTPLQSSPVQPTPVQPTPQQSAPLQPTPPQSATPITYEQIREVLTKKSLAGKQPEVRKLIREFGADMLTKIDPEDYPALLQRAGEL